MVYDVVKFADDQDSDFVLATTTFTMIVLRICCLRLWSTPCWGLVSAWCIQLRRLQHYYRMTTCTHHYIINVPFSSSQIVLTEWWASTYFLVFASPAVVGSASEVCVYGRSFQAQISQHAAASAILSYSTRVGSLIRVELVTKFLRLLLFANNHELSGILRNGNAMQRTPIEDNIFNLSFWGAVMGRRLVCEGILGYVVGYFANFALVMAVQRLYIYMHVWNLLYKLNLCFL